jgi:hypothetical protein
VPKKRTKRSLGRASTTRTRYVVDGPSNWKRTFHKSYDAAMKAAQSCSTKHPNAVCRVETGLPGAEHTVAECNRNECYGVSGGMGRRRRRKGR